MKSTLRCNLVYSSCRQVLDGQTCVREGEGREKRWEVEMTRIEMQNKQFSPLVHSTIIVFTIRMRFVVKNTSGQLKLKSNNSEKGVLQTLHIRLK